RGQVALRGVARVVLLHVVAEDQPMEPEVARPLPEPLAEERQRRVEGGADVEPAERLVVAVRVLVVVVEGEVEHDGERERRRPARLLVARVGAVGAPGFGRGAGADAGAGGGGGRVWGE